MTTDHRVLQPAGSAPRISMAVIARDEERCIGRALSSGQPLVDELVVIDTGSTDRTVDIAREHGALVGHFDWMDDFAAARNAALDACSGDLVFMVDADEWIDADDVDVLRRWADRNSGDSPPAGTAGIVKIHSRTVSDGQLLASVARIVRLVPRHSRFVGPIHEYASGYGAATEVDGLVLQHDGYLPEQVRRKNGRNERLLRAGLRLDPGNPYLTFQLGREIQISGDVSGAAAMFMEVLPGIGRDVPWRDELKARLLFCLQRAGRGDEALALVSRMMHGPDVSAEVLFAAGNLCLDLALERPAQHRRYVELARAAWRMCLQVGEPTDGRDFTPGCGSYLAAANLKALEAATQPTSSS